MKNSLISWTDHTFNPVWGCTQISEGCRNCYAKALSTRFRLNVFGDGVERRTFPEKHWRQPINWNRDAEKNGKKERVFCGSMCDIFEDHPTTAQERVKLWPLIRSTPHLQWLLLTKRAFSMPYLLPSDWGNGYPNVWLGVTVESDKYWYRAEQLHNIPAAVRFISYEPAIGPLNADFSRGKINWIIYGGESGPSFRPDKIEWAEDIRDECKRFGVNFYFKQRAGLMAGTNANQIPSKQIPKGNDNDA